jgi:hypothetical protein
MDFHGHPWKKKKKNSMEFPWNSMDLHGVLWNSMEFINSMDLHGLSTDLYGFPWTFHRPPWTFHGPPWSL